MPSAAELPALDVGPPLAAWRRQTAAGVLLTAVALGLQHVFEPDREEQDIVVVVAGADEPDAWGGRLLLRADGRGLYLLPAEVVLER